MIDRQTGAAGELILRQVDDAYEIIANGVFLMDTRNGESERLLVRLALASAPGGRLLIGGLGVGFSLREAVNQPAVDSIVVVEREAAVISWNRGVLRSVHGDALADPRVRCVCADLVPWLRTCGERFDAICLDVDNGPDWTVTEGNSVLYNEDGLSLLAGALTAGGVLAVWSASASPRFADVLRSRFARVEVHEVPVARGEPDVVYVAVQSRE